MRKCEKVLIEKIENQSIGCECCGAFGYQPSCVGCEYNTQPLLEKLAKLRGFDSYLDMCHFELELQYKLGFIPFI